MTTTGDYTTQKIQGYLEIRRETGELSRMPLQGDRMIIGRARDADIQLDSQTVSRKHAELFSDPFGRWWVRDLGSRNGTWVNKQRIPAERVFEPGDTMVVEEYAITFRTSVGQRTAEREKAQGGVRSTTVTMVDAEGQAGMIKSLADFEPPKLNAAHLSELSRFGTRLLGELDTGRRLEMLGELMVSSQFRGRTASVLRISRQDPSVEPEMVCEPRAAEGFEGRHAGYVSRTVLNAVRQQLSPILASNVGGKTSMVEMSLAGNVQMMAAIACPLHDDEQWLDVLYVSFPVAYGTGEWLSLVSLAVDQFQQAEAAWAARGRAEHQAVIEKELARARKIQMRLIPLNIQVDGLDLALGFEPCRWVGGDYVDVVPRADGRVLVTIADVCGKGLQAALVTASLHTMVHTSVAAEIDLQPMMTQLNHYLCKALPDDSFVTMIAMVVDPATGELEIANAGHPPALVIGPDASVRELSSGDNLPVGIVPGPIRTTAEQLGDEDWLTLFTDGLTELADPEDRMLGLQGVAKLFGRIARQRADDASDLGKRIDAALDAYQGDRLPRDDRTYLLMRQGKNST